jgi:hypothetical protein
VVDSADGVLAGCSHIPKYSKSDVAAGSTVVLRKLPPDHAENGVKRQLLLRVFQV